jgi:aldehyde:ferredoxin oxidoreductase
VKEATRSCGWTGRLLVVDLTRRKITKERLDLEWARTHIGGRGFTAGYLFETLPAGIDPLGPQNQLIFAPGPTCGTLVPGSQRWTVGAKSPLTGFIGDSNCGGSFGVGLKYAGYDMLVVQGKSDKPVYLLIDGPNALLRDADHLWGMTTVESERALKSEVGDPGLHIATTGTAGDHLVKFATVSSDNRKAGRTGMGAVMGSKNLKAVAARGGNGVLVASPGRVESLGKSIWHIWRGNERRLRELREYGGGVDAGKIYEKLGILQTRNYRERHFPAFEDIAERMRSELWLKPRACFSCPIACGHVYVLSDGPYAGTYGDGLYGSAIWYSARLGNANAELMCKLTDLSDRLGMDAANLSGILGWLMECFELGLISARDLDGVEMTWGNPESILRMTEMIAHRAGVGDLLAEGAHSASRAIGRGTESFVMHVKGMDLDSRDPRGSKGWGLGYAVGSRGADHCRHLVPDLATGSDRFVEKGKGAIHKWHEDLRAFEHALEICLFVCEPQELDWVQILAEIYSAVTGVDSGREEVLVAGERIVNLERAFNVRDGLTRSDDSLPARFLGTNSGEESPGEDTVNLDLMIDEYYEARAWERASGFPRRKKLEELGLSSAADELDGMGRLR